jgi:Zn-dependent protease
MYLEEFSKEKQKKVFGIQTSNKEIFDIVKAWAAISLAFAILLSGSMGITLLFYFLISGFTVGIGFLFHELAHKLMAQKYKCWAEFRSMDRMLIIAIVCSFFGFVLAAPGAVMIRGTMLKDEYGKISAAGPLMNFILAIIFFGIMFISSNEYITLIGTYGFFVNTWLGLFNLIPFGIFDGIKIYRWNKYVWGGLLAFGIILFMMTQIV